MAEAQEASENDFRNELKALINKHSMENSSNTPDHILADYLIRCIDNFTETTQSRESWYGVKLRPGAKNASSNESSMGSTSTKATNN